MSRRRDADGVSSATADGAAGYGLKGFVQADLNGGEVVVAAGDGEAGFRERWIAVGEQLEQLDGWHGDLMVECG